MARHIGDDQQCGDLVHLQAFHFHGAIGADGFVIYANLGNSVPIIIYIIYIISQVYLYYSSDLVEPLIDARYYRKTYFCEP